MAILKIPKANSTQRESFLLEESELVYDKEKQKVYCGNGVDMGGFPIGNNKDLKTHRILLDQNAISTKTITIPFNLAAGSTITVTPEGGIPQVMGIDFLLSGNIISWDGLGLDGFLEVGEHLTVTGFEE